MDSNRKQCLCGKISVYQQPFISKYRNRVQDISPDIPLSGYRETFTNFLLDLFNRMLAITQLPDQLPGWIDHVDLLMLG